MTDKLKRDLEKAGVLLKDAISRCVDSEELYETLLIMFPSDKSYSLLLEAVEKKNAEEAYLQSHTLKGVAANIGLEGIYNATIPIMNLSKAGNTDIPSYMIDNLKQEYNKIIVIINDNLS